MTAAIELVRLADERLDRESVVGIADRVMRGVALPALLPGGSGGRAALNGLAFPVAYLCAATSNGRGPREAERFFVRALVANSAEIVRELRPARQRHCLAELRSLGDVGRWVQWWIGLVYDAERPRPDAAGEGLADRYYLLGLTAGGYNRRREEQRLSALLEQLSA